MNLGGFSNLITTYSSNKERILMFRVYLIIGFRDLCMTINKAIIKMKNVINIFICALVIGLASSCSSTHKIVVAGTPNTQIYSPTGERLAAIDNSGKTEIDLTADAYYSYLLSQTPGSNEYVPFALDYKNYSYTGAKTAKYTGYGVSAVGAGAALIGAIAMIGAGSNGDEDSTDSFGLISGVGGGVALLGCAIGLPADSRLDQTSYKYQFKYLKDQRTNNDFMFTKPKIDYVSGVSQVVYENNRDEAATDNDGIVASVVSGKKVSSHSTKTFKDYGENVEGEYKGTGTLKLDDEVIEKYSDITVVIERVSDNTVNVNVIEGEDKFFKYPLVYNVEKKGSGYSLTCRDIKSAIIKIDKNKRMVFVHPRINIDGDIYSLSINSVTRKK